MTASRLARTFRRILPLAVLATLATAAAVYAHQRWISANFHEVLPGQIYRSAQPSPAQLAAWTDENALATVLNLRDDRAFGAEADLARAAGLHYVHLPFSDRDPPERLALLALLDSLETLPRPLLIHCRAGADRTGTASALALMAVGGRTFDEARRQLAARYLHFAGDRGAIEGVVLRYADHCARLNVDPGGWTEFRRWVRDHYSEEYFMVDVIAPDTVRTPPATLTAIELVIQNLTDRILPAGRPGHPIKLAAYAGSAVDMVPDREYPPRLRLTQPIEPYGSQVVEMEFWSPGRPGVYEIRYGLLEEHVTWFCTVGAPEPARVLVVEEP